MWPFSQRQNLFEMLPTPALGHLQNLCVAFDFSPLYAPVETKHLPSIKAACGSAFITLLPKVDQVMPRSLLTIGREVKMLIFFFFTGDQCLSYDLVVESVWPCFKMLF